jgi:hypothetical protein
MGNTTLSYEEFTTVLCQVEACVNSRTLALLSANTDKVEALTPGYFLIGRAMLAPLQPAAATLLLRRWHFVKQLQKDIWKKWQAD